MPIYPYFCQCGNEKTIECQIDDINNIKCDQCGNKMDQDFSKKNILFELKGLGWSKHGHSTDIDQAEEEMKKRGLPVGSWVGNWCQTDKNGKAICNQKRRGRKKTETVYVQEKVECSV